MFTLLSLTRPRQSIKNGFVIAPIIFAQQFMSVEAWALILQAALAFTLVACVVYIFNDWRDRAEDALHPVKRLRPLASGAVSGTSALLLAAACAIGAALLLSRLPVDCGIVVAAYAVLNIAYTFRLKHVALVDVFSIALCFVLRVLMGCAALEVEVSPWILLTTFMLALFLSFGKRYQELAVAGYAVTKKNLADYSRELLIWLIIICNGSALVCYAIYTAETNARLVYTVPFVAFGLFRYLQKMSQGEGGEPESVIIRDRWQWANISLWLAVTLWALSGA